MRRTWVMFILAFLAAGCGRLAIPGAGGWRTVSLPVNSSEPGVTTASPAARHGSALVAGDTFLPPSAVGAGLLLPGADGAGGEAGDWAGDEAPEEIVPLLRPAPPVPPDFVPEGRERGASYKLGFRGGYLSSGGAERDWKEAPSYGLYVRRVPTRSAPVKSRWALEVGADFAAAETEDEARSSSLVFLRAGLLFGRFGVDDSRGGLFYVVAGGQAILEDSTNNVTGISASGRGGGAEAGLGYGARDGRWDLRATYSLLFASENAENGVAVSLGFAF